MSFCVCVWTGQSEIEKACDLLFQKAEILDYRYDVHDRSVEGLLILPLYGSMPTGKISSWTYLKVKSVIHHSPQTIQDAEHVLWQFPLLQISNGKSFSLHRRVWESAWLQPTSLQLHWRSTESSRCHAAPHNSLWMIQLQKQMCDNTPKTFYVIQERPSTFLVTDISLTADL